MSISTVSASMFLLYLSFDVISSLLQYIITQFQSFPFSTSFRTTEKWLYFSLCSDQKRQNFISFFLQIHDALERDNEDIDSSGSGYGGEDDEDEIRNSKDKESRVNKDQTSNTHHSGDGSDDEDYIENHEDERKPLPIEGEDDNLYFENTSAPSTSTSSNNNIINPSIITDDEDSQFTFFFLLIIYF